MDWRMAKDSDEPAVQELQPGHEHMQSAN